MNKVNSVQNMLVVIAILDLALIPHSIAMQIRGLAHDIGVSVISWLEEQMLIVPIKDLTLSDELCTKTQHDNVRAQIGYPHEPTSTGMVAIEFNTLLPMWERLPISPVKDKLEQTLRSSPHFEAYLASKKTEYSG